MPTEKDYTKAQDGKRILLTEAKITLEDTPKTLTVGVEADGSYTIPIPKNHTAKASKNKKPGTFRFASNVIRLTVQTTRARPHPTPFLKASSVYDRTSHRGTMQLPAQCPSRRRALSDALTHPIG
ncbi:MAG: hypothetical protein L6R38_005092 [Xanthoria sp. 2 TBL-2021]|nr:MAG: hypothetical protein L6R38_005092 [Xanthoria sp. 2 TBL-2021]